METNGRRLVVVGQGYVGLPLAMRAVEVGFNVVGVDTDDDKISAIRGGKSPVEDVSGQRLEVALASGRYQPTSDAAGSKGFDVAVISVPTPLLDGVPDLKYVEQAAADLSAHLRLGACVILESTTYPGTTEEVVAPILEQGSGLRAGPDFHLGYSPERIDPGNAEWRFENTPKVVSGIDEASLAVVQTFYGELVEKTVAVSSPKEAELTKLLENTFRHVNIALVNELAMFAHDLGIDVWEAIDAATTKPFGYMRFTPGPGVGGHCLPIDPSYLSWRVRQSLGHSFRFVELANDVNDHMPDYVVQRVVELLNGRSLPVNGRRVLLLGLAYKKNTGDARESPSRRICELLLGLGADIRVADPHVVDHHVPAGVTRVELTAEEAASADLAVLIVDHDDFDLDLLVRHATLVFDTRNRLTAPNVVPL
ncbi:nucleotide sugar dehydrogenase [Rhabdothermincola salaria]|uniref:nucleotide sugar dehydrogenase n=1 Tax=Rhabdothermincola salaria TaxID=2903142 RepID=UPI001E46E621|nr:nucleotide sugar dehydrogenase [Rhabdothermincola salaria]MCD9622770.1 nucleotide sugar dehydrogenase [Rhabdothermincola salaria]